MEVQGYNFYPHVYTLVSQNSSCTWGQFKAITVTTATGRGVTIFWSPQTLGLSMKKWIQKKVSSSVVLQSAFRPWAPQVLGFLSSRMLTRGGCQLHVPLSPWRARVSLLCMVPRDIMGGRYTDTGITSKFTDGKPAVSSS
jgi:hypothetical protein